MICSSENRFFTSNLVAGVRLYTASLLKSGGTSAPRGELGGTKEERASPEAARSTAGTAGDA
jgi:hypothetical protein